MTETAWTPGPLAVDPVRAWIVCSQLDDDGDPCPVAALAWPTKYRSEAETLANAQLYAAAPMLAEGAQDTLEALKLLRVGLVEKAPETIEAIDAHIDELSYALARARGETL